MPQCEVDYDGSEQRQMQPVGQKMYCVEVIIQDLKHLQLTENMTLDRRILNNKNQGRRLVGSRAVQFPLSVVVVFFFLLLSYTTYYYLLFLFLRLSYYLLVVLVFSNVFFFSSCFFVLDLTRGPRVYGKQLLYPHEVGVRLRIYHLPQNLWDLLAML